MTTKAIPESRIYPALGVELRAEKVEGGHRYIHGRAVPYNDPADIGFYIEEHVPGSFKRSIKDDAADLPLLLFHQDTVFPIGRTDSWNDNQGGLDGVWQLDEDDPLAMKAADKAEKGMLSYMSIRFQPHKSEWTFTDDYNPDLGKKDTVRRLQSRLVEVSLVSTPAFKNATVEFVRTAERRREVEDPTAEIRAWRDELDKLRA